MLLISISRLMHVLLNETRAGALQERMSRLAKTKWAQSKYDTNKCHKYNLIRMLLISISLLACVA